jgi:hypothetical protein
MQLPMHCHVQRCYRVSGLPYAGIAACREFDKQHTVKARPCVRVDAKEQIGAALRQRGNTSCVFTGAPRRRSSVQSVVGDC